ncbi:MAG: nicotinamide-nucleotide amidohydrolase family protein [bacterium]|nr:nicotinamide-nucleotide amidohydrolase family protein [bacterium]
MRAIIGEHIYGMDQESLESAVVRLLHERRKKMATAESCTGGLVAHLLTNIPGASAVFQGGIVSYSNRAKIDLLDVDEAIIRNHGAVSPECAAAMAVGAARALKADIALSLTGIAGPGGGSEEKPVGLVYIGLSTPDGQAVKEARFGGGREENKLRFARTALDMLRRYLLTGELTGERC